jgi:hypothetical protein
VIELLLQAEGALSVGLLDRAEAVYRQVISADPRNSIAVVGLARVALERSDEVGALGLARSARVIDPENDAARRMVERLEEVLRTRGVVVPPEPVARETGAEQPPTAAPPPNSPPGDPQATAPLAPFPDKRSYVDRLLGRRRK